MKLKILSLSTFLVFFLISSVFSNELLDIYKEKYLRLKSENEQIQVSLKKYSELLEEIELTNYRIDVLDSDYRNYMLNKTEYLTRKKRELEHLNKSLHEALSVYNKDYKQNRNDISINDIKSEIKRMNERATHIEDEIIDLKIKIVEKFGDLPEWAQNANKENILTN